MPPNDDEQSFRAKVRVLLVEDNPVDARLMEFLFRKMEGQPFQLVWVKCLADGINRIADGDINLVLLDLTLPDSEGLETFNQVHAAAKHVPIIVLSGTQDARIAVESVQRGAQDYLVKGHVDAHLLERAMRYGLEREKMAAQLARYTRELAAKNEQMEGELQLAKEIQKAYLPEQALSFPTTAREQDVALRFHHRYSPAEALGGDFFNVLSLSDTEAGVLICDVIGHGVQAALITGVLRGLVEELKDWATDPGEFLTKMNRGLMGVLRPPYAPSLTTAFFLVCDITSGRVRYATAGHPSPFLIRRGEPSVQPLPLERDCHGPALGLLEHAVYCCADATLSEGDLVMMFTDGLCELGGDVRASYQDDWLLEAVRLHVQLPAPQLFDQLMVEAHAQCAGLELSDDVCIVGVEVARLGEVLA